MARLSTHVLDTAAGRPAAGVRIVLRRGGAVLADTVTNRDGRTDAPLLSGERLPAGPVELSFHVGDYFAAAGAVPPGPRFLDVVTLGFGLWEETGDYHVPLLVTPWGYTTYRGS